MMGGAEHPAGGGALALVIAGDHQLHAPKAAVGRTARGNPVRAPERPEATPGTLRLPSSSTATAAISTWLTVRHRGAAGASPMTNAVYVALGVTRDGEREVLGLWVADSWRGQETIRGIVSSDNGRQVLAVGDDRAAQPNRRENDPQHRLLILLIRPGHPDRRGGRAEGLSRGDHRGLPRDHGPDLRAPSGSNRWRLNGSPRLIRSGDTRSRPVSCAMTAVSP